MQIERLLIELGDEPVGVAVCEGKKFRFYAAHAGVMKLDKAIFTSPGAIENACKVLAARKARVRFRAHAYPRVTFR
jgi:hypothetical protein